MNRIWTSTTLAAALGCAVTLSGQAGTGNPTASSATQQPAGDAHRTVTVVGCVQRGGATGEATGTSGVTGAGASSTSGSMGWILANASTEAGGAATSGTNSSPNATPSVNREAGGAASAAGRAEAVPAGPGGGANRGMSGTTYILEQGTKPGSQDLSAHAGHKVEITGTLAGTPNPGVTGANTSTETGRATSSTSQTSVTAPETAKAGQRLQVATVKMLSPNCS